MKKNIVLKGIMLLIVVGVICGIIYQKNYAVISDEIITNIVTPAINKEFYELEIGGIPSLKSDLVRAVGVTTVDLTGLATGSEVSHICSNYLVTKYDSTNHWKECSVCGKKVI